MAQNWPVFKANQHQAFKNARGIFCRKRSFGFKASAVHHIDESLRVRRNGV
jgi:hypothetical protein